MAEVVPAWEVDPEFTGEGMLTLKDPDGWFEASVRFDGCLNYWEFANTPTSEDREEDPCDEYLHICNIDDFIARLESIKAQAIKHFGRYPQ